MEEYKRYFEKKYFLNFLVYFVIWYLGIFLLFMAYQLTGIEVFQMVIFMFSPILLFLITYRYFKRSFNDWEDRFIVGTGWVLMSVILFAGLSELVYGIPWTEAISVDLLFSRWADVIAVLFAGFIVHRS